jgi:hypothetical protein
LSQSLAQAAVYNLDMSWQGFDKIQSLKTPVQQRPLLTQSRVHSGLQAMRTGPTNILAGLVDADIIPADSYQGTMSNRLQVVDEITDMMDLLDSSSARISQRQRDVITKMKSGQCLHRFLISSNNLFGSKN